VSQKLLEGCIDEVIAQHLHDIEFDDASISLGDTTCSVITINKTDEQKEVQLSVSDGDTTQSIFIVIDLAPITILSIHK
jgi:hypothetical protein